MGEKNKEEDPYVTYAVAMKLLGIGSGVMSRLLDTGELPYKEHPFDKRRKLIKLSDINRLRSIAVPPEPSIHHTITKWIIYALVDPRDETIWYVGRTVRAKARLQQHLEEAGVNPAKTKWLRELRKEGLAPRMETLETLDCRGDEAEVRERFWIQHFSSLGAPLTNIRGV